MTAVTSSDAGTIRARIRWSGRTWTSGRRFRKSAPDFLATIIAAAPAWRRLESLSQPIAHRRARALL